MKLEGRTALVTGAGSGIGRAIAACFAREGASVVINDVAEEAAQETASQIDGSTQVIVADVGCSDRVKRMFAETEERFGGLDVLVNNAGIEDGARDTVGIGDEAWERMVAVHLTGSFYCTRAAIPLMARNARGSIVNVSSVAALMGGGMVHYSAAKAGVLGLTRAVAADVGPLGIRVNAICPGYIETPMTRRGRPAHAERVAASVPLRRVGQPEDVAATALFLASDESSYFTGQWLSPNGGMVMI